VSLAGASAGDQGSQVARVTGVPFPNDAELVYEGFMPSPAELTMHEGPFGEWPGYYAASGPEPVLQVKAIYHRDDPIQCATPPARPIYPGTYFGTAGLGAHPRRLALDDLEAAGVPGIKGVWKMPGGGSRFINVIAIEQMHAGHAKMAGLVAAGCGSSTYLGRIIILVDDDIDITKRGRGEWAVATRWDPRTATDIIDGVWTGYIDPMLLPERRAKGRPHQQPHHHLRGAAVCVEGRVSEGECGRSWVRGRGRAQMGGKAKILG